MFEITTQSSVVWNWLHSGTAERHRLFVLDSCTRRSGKGMHCTSSNHCSAKQYFLEQGTSKSVVILQVQPTFPQDNSHFQNFELPSKLTTSISKVSIKDAATEANLGSRNETTKKPGNARVAYSIACLPVKLLAAWVKCHFRCTAPCPRSSLHHHGGWRYQQPRTSWNWGENFETRSE